MWGDQRVSCVSVLHCSTLLCMAVLCRVMHSSVQELTGERPVCKQHRSLSCQQ
ncbi:unnamed protein product [Staurois parvus]|uniref:Uncharacterized protein n=1 Tax=Staurois parvus TaxID=386267 RepID=A0ABN9FBJ0_9NEOB|nr:unnamed protein product [Staurois parvus]